MGSNQTTVGTGTLGGALGVFIEALVTPLIVKWDIPMPPGAVATLVLLLVQALTHKDGIKRQIQGAK